MAKVQFAPGRKTRSEGRCRTSPRGAKAQAVRRQAGDAGHPGGPCSPRARRGKGGGASEGILAAKTRAGGHPSTRMVWAEMVCTSKLIAGCSRSTQARICKRAENLAAGRDFVRTERCPPELATRAPEEQDQISIANAQRITPVSSPLCSCESCCARCGQGEVRVLGRLLFCFRPSPAPLGSPVVATRTRSSSPHTRSCTRKLPFCAPRCPARAVAAERATRLSLNPRDAPSDPRRPVLLPQLVPDPLLLLHQPCVVRRLSRSSLRWLPRPQGACASRPRSGAVRLGAPAAHAAHQRAKRALQRSSAHTSVLSAEIISISVGQAGVQIGNA